MSYDGKDEKDLPLKLRMMNLLWQMGWFVRPNVKLYMYYEGTRTGDQYTDLDVIGISIQPLTRPLIAICSAKSGKESDSSQILWLAGVKTYFGADQAYYVRNKADLRKARVLCDKLGIVPLNEEQLKAIESRTFPADYKTPFMFTQKAYDKINQYFEELKKAKKELYSYITERFWIDDESLQLMRMITGIRDVSRLALSKECKIFLKYYMASLLSLPLLRLTQRFSTIPWSLYKAELDTTLKGGELARSEKEKMIRELKILMQEFLKHTSLSDDMFSKGIDLDKMFKLDYFEELLDLIVRLVEHYSKSIYIPRMMDALAFCLLELGDPKAAFDNISLPELSPDQNAFVSKLAKDILVFLVRIKALDGNEVS